MTVTCSDLRWDCIASLISSAILLFFYVKLKRLQDSQLMTQLAWLSVSNLAISVMTIVQISVMSSDGNSGSACAILGGFMYFFYIQAIYWNTAIVFNLWFVLKKAETPDFEETPELDRSLRLPIYYHILGWGLPFFATVFLGVKEQFGLLSFSPIWAGACLIREANSYMWIFWGAPMFLAFVVISFMFCKLIFSLRHVVENNLLAEVMKMGLGILLSFLLTWTPSFCVHLIGLMPVTPETSAAIQGFAFTGCFTVSLQGFMTLFIYLAHGGVRRCIYAMYFLQKVPYQPLNP